MDSDEGEPEMGRFVDSEMRAIPPRPEVRQNRGMGSHFRQQVLNRGMAFGGMASDIGDDDWVDEL